MKIVEKLKLLLKEGRAEIKVTLQERDFVRNFGDKPRNVRWCGSADLVGLRVIGERRGFRVERGPKGRSIRVIEVVHGKQVLTHRCMPLRFKDSQVMLTPGVRSWVQ